MGDCSGSEVFYAQFNGHFAEAWKHSREHPIVVEDIEPSTFEDVLRYMYCEKITVTQDNLVDVCYASRKYLLVKLNAICEEYFRSQINEDNVLKIFNDNRRNEFEVVNEICLSIISDNPLKFFRYTDFCALDRRSLELIARRPTMNCQLEQLKKAVHRWLQSNISEGEDGIDVSQIVPQREAWYLQCHTFRSYDAFHYATAVTTNITISADRKFYLYGLGIFVGAQSNCSAEFFVTLNVRVDNNAYPNSLRVPYSLVEKMTVPVKAEMYVQEVVFEKVVIDRYVDWRITVTIEGNDGRPMFCMDSFNPVYSRDRLQLEVVNPNVMYRYESIYRLSETCSDNCVAYLLYNV